MYNLNSQRKLNLYSILFLLLLISPVAYSEGGCPNNAQQLITEYSNLMFRDMMNGNFSSIQAISLKIQEIQVACTPSYKSQPLPNFPAYNNIPQMPPSIYQDGGTLHAPGGSCGPSGCILY